MKHKYQPGIQIIRDSPEPASSDVERWEAINDEFFKAFNVEKQPVPVGYSGSVPPRSESEKRSWMACLRDNDGKFNSENDDLEENDD